MRRVLAVRLDSMGDVLLTGPALRALAHRCDRLDLLTSTGGAAAGRMLPGVDRVETFDPPWSGFRPPPVLPAELLGLVERLRDNRYDTAVVFTSYHQSPLPAALVARLAGIGRVAATCVDYPGSLLDVRHRRPAGHEVVAALDLARAAGGELPPGDTGRLAVRMPTPAVDVPDRRYVVVHPGASVGSRSLRPDHAAELVRGLRRAGWPVVVTGGAGEAFPAGAAGDDVSDLVGRTDCAGLAAVLAGACCVVAGNTGPAHLAAAVGTPVVSLFSPVVPAEHWAPYGVASVVLGDQHAACRLTRARQCPVAGHPCLTGVRADAVVAAVGRLAGAPDERGAAVTASRGGTR